MIVASQLCSRLGGGVISIRRHDSCACRKRQFLVQGGASEMIFFKPAAFALALTAFGVTPAVAQEQENPSTPGQIPDPSTYQGSTVLQQQSDQQDQQFRQQQQQQQPTYQQPTQSYSGGQQRNSGSSQSQYQMCLNRVASSRI